MFVPTAAQMRSVETIASTVIDIGRYAHWAGRLEASAIDGNMPACPLWYGCQTCLTGLQKLQVFTSSHDEEWIQHHCRGNHDEASPRTSASDFVEFRKRRLVWNKMEWSGPVWALERCRISPSGTTIYRPPLELSACPDCCGTLATTLL